MVGNHRHPSATGSIDLWASVQWDAAAATYRIILLIDICDLLLMFIGAPFPCSAALRSTLLISGTEFSTAKI